MRQWLIHAALTTTLLLAFCLLFPASAAIAAYIVDRAPIFGAAFIFAFLISRQTFSYWWAEKIQLRGVGSKSGWQRHQRKQQQEHR